ncbi:hypothetical protein BOX15_Mlig027001g1 [Macrostomum lignano]|uniref:Major facilitator superfamily (MFS) profile domain-containing protein n=3 Tax=Macrostomum lignano TaxID=282301 RepID=A0A267H1U0_9PLAT|nr:hypothetical protein BOX15_Mlig027001g1 [Macrostomum lignano]
MDAVFRGTSHCGCFQLVTTFLPFFIAVVAPVHILGPIFVLYVPNHRCRLPPSSAWSANDSILPASPEHAAAISDFIPTVDNSSEFDTCHYRLNGSVTACSDWIFDSEQFESTIVTEYKLVCSRQKLTTILSTCTFGGLLCGIFISGMLSDWLGRRKCLLLSVWLLTLADVAACFTVSPIYSAIAFLLVGAGILPAYTVGYVMLFELVGPKARHHVGSITAYCSAIGATVPPLIAMTTRSWRGYSLVTLSLTSLALALAHLPYFAPETPRWLLSRGRDSEAAAVVRRMLRMNGAKNPQQLLKEMREAGRRLTGGTQSVTKSMMLLAKSPNLVMRFCIICCNWFGVSAAFYGISMASKNLPGGIFFITGMLGLAEFPAALFMQVAADRIGRKSTYLTSLAGSGFFMLVLALTSVWAAGLTWVIVALSLASKMLIGVSYLMAYMWTAELAPTSVRGAVLSISSLFARLGTLFAPVLGHLDVFIGKEFGPAVAFLVFSASCFVIAGLACALPETRGMPLPDTAEDLLKSRRANYRLTDSTDEKQNTQFVDEEKSKESDALKPADNAIDAA